MKEQSLAILHSNDEMIRSADQYFPYRQHADLFYLTGINQERTVLLLAPDHPESSMREILFIRNADSKLETWEGHKLSQDEASAISGISQVRFISDFDSALATLMQYARNVYVNGPENTKFIPEIPCRNLRFAEELKKKYPAHAYERLAPVMRELRMVKSPWEISLIECACRITRDGFFRVLKCLRPGMKEYEVEAEITHEFIRQGTWGHAFPPIIASGSGALTLHYISNDRTCNEGDLLLIDFGTEYGNYASDCSRTIPVNGRFTLRQKQVYESVLRLFQYARSLMVPGASINKVHEAVCRRMETEHIRLGLYTEEDLRKQEKESFLLQRYYMHGTSHFLGLDVHDVGLKDEEFRPGMVLTCEPGIYIREEQLGIRLENDILITEQGNRDLMEDIPMAPDDIEALMRG